MPIISHMGVDYDSPNIQIQDNASATDLDNTKIPTGQTIENYIKTKGTVTYTDRTVTTGTSTYDGFYYGEIGDLGESSNKMIISAFIVTVANNSWASVQKVGTYANYNLRVYTKASSKSVTVRVVYLNT